MTTIQPSDRILSKPALIERRQQLRQQGQKVVFTNGCFDLLHRAHIEYLWEARQLGDVLMIGLNSDASVRALKGSGRPLVPQEDRAALLVALRSVDYLCFFDEESVESMVTDLLPDVLVKGGDYRPDQIVGRESVEKAGGQVKTLSLWRDSSTSTLIHKIRQLPL